MRVLNGALTANRAAELWQYQQWAVNGEETITSGSGADITQCWRHYIRQTLSFMGNALIIWMKAI